MRPWWVPASISMCSPSSSSREFCQKVGIETIYFLVAKKNAQYIRIVQDLMIVGFEVDENLKTVNIDGKVYKVLMLTVKEEYDEIEEVFF